VSGQEEFFCPCHNGVFDKDGNVVSGPPPRPLDRFEVKVEDDQLFILGG
jgi:Rieske Fe-S protein